MEHLFIFFLDFLMELNHSKEWKQSNFLSFFFFFEWHEMEQRFKL